LVEKLEGKRPHSRQWRRREHFIENYLKKWKDVGWLYFPPDRDWCRDLGSMKDLLRRPLLHAVNSYRPIERRIIVVGILAGYSGGL
jgi:hypothetical protein